MTVVDEWIRFFKELLPPLPTLPGRPVEELPPTPPIPEIPPVEPPAKPPTPVQKCQDPGNPDTWPAVPAGWAWDPTTDAWLAYRPGGIPLEHYEFVAWKYGLTQDEWDYLVFRYNVAAGNDAQYRGAWGVAETPSCLMPDRYCSPNYPDWYSGWRGYYTRNLTAAQVSKVEQSKVSPPVVQEVESRVMDEIMMRQGVHNSRPGSRYYRENWYVFYRYAPPEYVREYMDNPCPTGPGVQRALTWGAWAQQVLPGRPKLPRFPRPPLFR